MEKHSRFTERDELGNADIIGIEDCLIALSFDFEELNLITAALNRLGTQPQSGI